jgi:hypothetical protein
MDQLVELFESLLSPESIQQLVQRQECESLHLEFKRKEHPNNPEVGNSDKASWSQALSGFANSDGGVIVWGVATVQEDGVDRANELAPISAVPDFASRLRASLLHATAPVVDGVRVEAVRSADNAGFVVCLIPQSPKTPHRAMLSHREYYKRSTERFYRLEHFDLEDMFGRRPRPLLTFDATVRTKRVIWLHNRGRGMAMAPYLELLVSGPFRFSQYGVDGNGGYGLPRLVQHGWSGRLQWFGCDATKVIPPGTSLSITRLEYDGPAQGDGPIPGTVVTLKYQIAAEGFALKHGQFDLVIP